MGISKNRWKADSRHSGAASGIFTISGRRADLAQLAFPALLTGLLAAQALAVVATIVSDKMPPIVLDIFRALLTL